MERPRSCPVRDSYLAGLNCRRSVRHKLSRFSPTATNGSVNSAKLVMSRAQSFSFIPMKALGFLVLADAPFMPVREWTTPGQNIGCIGNLD